MEKNGFFILVSSQLYKRLFIVEYKLTREIEIGYSSGLEMQPKWVVIWEDLLCFVRVLGGLHARTDKPRGSKQLPSSPVTPLLLAFPHWS
jgi:hypothetical protein